MFLYLKYMSIILQNPTDFPIYAIMVTLVSKIMKNHFFNY